MTSNGRCVDRYIYDLPYPQHEELCRILDRDMKWEELGGKYMEFNMNTIIDLRRDDQRGRSPTRQLLTMWGQQNHTVVQLFVLLSKMHHYQAMTVLKPLVDPKYHPLLDDGEENISKLLDKEDNASNYHNEHNSNDGGGNNSVRHSESTMDNNMNLWGDNLNRREYPREMGRDKLDMLPEHHERKILNKPIALKIEPNQRYVGVPRVMVDSPSSNVSPSHLPLPHGQHVGTGLRSEGRETCPFRQERKMSGASDVSSIAESIPLITYQELENATNGWDKKTIIGKGGFGTVFKGNWKNTLVAIKRIEQRGAESTETHQAQMEQLLQELRILNSRRHDNILPLYGFSSDGLEPCLVYQFMPNGSLEDRLLCRQVTPPLNWIQRHNIARGTARGLQFLHMKPPYIHGDIKSANILLDKNFEPRIGDFGLARDGPQGHYTHMKISRIHGTLPYLPADFLRNKQLSIKVDTYSFGIVMFELATGLRAYDDKRPQKHLRDFVMKWDPNDMLQLHDRKPGLVDPFIYEYLIQLGKTCACERARDRPEMEGVFKLLEAQYCQLMERAHYLPLQASPSPSPVPRVMGMSPEPPTFRQGAVMSPMLLVPTPPPAVQFPPASLLPVIHPGVSPDDNVPLQDVGVQESLSSLSSSVEVDEKISAPPPSSQCSSPSNAIVPLLSVLGTVDNDSDQQQRNTCHGESNVVSQAERVESLSLEDSSDKTRNNAQSKSRSRPRNASCERDITARGKTSLVRSSN